MHPSKDILERFVIGLADGRALEAEIKNHIEICEFCREYCEGYRRFLDNVAEEGRDRTISADIKAKAGDLYRQALSHKIIPVKLLDMHAGADGLYLAADGKSEGDIKYLATLYSEDPDVVLRVMRDMQKGYDYAQVISEDPDLSANVMIQLPDIGREYVVDSNGRARLDGLENRDLEKIKWQLKMPQAVFTVEPLEYDPDRTEKIKDFILETDKGDRLKIIIEQKTEGKQVSVQVLEIDGRADFVDARVNILCKSTSLTKGSVPEQVVSFGPIDIAEKIQIRIYT